MLKVSRSGYYAWMHRSASPRAVRRQQLAHEIRQGHRESRAVYGSPRVFQALKARGVLCSENTVAKVMKAEGVRSKASRSFAVKTTDSRHDHPVAWNVLNREFHPALTARRRSH